MKRRTFVGDLGGKRLRSGDWERERLAAQLLDYDDLDDIS